MNKRIWKLAIISLLIFAFAAACGETTPEEPTPEPTPRDLMAFDFQDVCQGGGVDAAAAYDAEAPGPHPVLVMNKYNPEQNNWSEVYGVELPVNWIPFDDDDDFTQVQLVACGERVETEFVENCDYEDDESDDVFLLDVYSATYEVTIVAARTGEVIGTESITAEADGCPMLHFFSEQEEETFETPWSLTAFEDLLRSYVEP